MGRWEPDARGRLGEAAMELYAERGYEQTTVAEIAERAGLTARTFFRYFADKREVLFAGSEALGEQLVAAHRRRPGRRPRRSQAVAAAPRARRRCSSERRDFARRRQAVIAANAELQERELIKLAALGRPRSRTALRRRGVAEPTASLAAEAGVAVFRVAFERWLGRPRQTAPSRTPCATRSTSSAPSSPGVDDPSGEARPADFVPVDS